MADCSSNAHSSGAQASTADDATLLRDRVTRALTEFVQTDYAGTVCRYCNVNPAAIGQIGCIFESVKIIEDAKLDVKLHGPVEHKADQILNKLAAHLRATVPQLKRLQYEICGGWGTNDANVAAASSTSSTSRPRRHARRVSEQRCAYVGTRVA